MSDLNEKASKPACVGGLAIALVKEFQESAQRFKLQGNDEGEVCMSAAAARVHEVFTEFFETVRKLREETLERRVGRPCYEALETACYEMRHSLRGEGWTEELLNRAFGAIGTDQGRGFVMQPWVTTCTFMQQTVLLTAVRGPDGLRKESPAKPVMRAFRRVILLSAIDGKALHDPCEPGGGSFTGPCKHPEGLEGVMRDFIRGADEYPHHFLMHVIHAVEIVGYKHPDPAVAAVWRGFYEALCQGLHMNPEAREQLDFRLGDSREQWLATQQTPIGEIVQ